GRRADRSREAARAAFPRFAGGHREGEQQDAEVGFTSAEGRAKRPRRAAAGFLRSGRPMASIPLPFPAARTNAKVRRMPKLSKYFETKRDADGVFRMHVSLDGYAL